MISRILLASSLTRDDEEVQEIAVLLQEINSIESLSLKQSTVSKVHGLLSNQPAQTLTDKV